MFPSVGAGTSHSRSPEIDDLAGAFFLYPGTFSGSGFGVFEGSVLTTSNDPVFGALVVAVDPEGRAVVSGYTTPDGAFSVLAPAGTYTIYAEPMNDPFLPGNAGSLADSFPGLAVDADFTVRFR
jgi:hypothetical protein